MIIARQNLAFTPKKGDRIVRYPGDTAEIEVEVVGVSITANGTQYSVECEYAARVPSARDA